MNTNTPMLAGATVALALALQTPAFGHGEAPESSEAIQAQISAVRRATAPFNDVQTAIGAGYSQFLSCVDEAGEGAMGIH
jgi:hypothetical protein